MRYLLLVVCVCCLSGCLRNGKDVENSDITLINQKTEAVQQDSSTNAAEEIELPVGITGYTPVAGFSVIQEKDVVTIFFAEKNWIWQDLKLSDLKLNNSGWYEAKVRNQNYVILRGGNFFQIISGDLSNNGDLVLWVSKPSKEYAEADEIYDFGIQLIKASSTLSDVINGNSIIYSTDKMDEIFFHDYLGISRYWNAEHHPWVEGELGPGLGVTLDITFKEPSDHMLVLNGFVDLQRRHLFKANNRVKKAIIRSLDKNVTFEFEYNFNDAVEFSHIPFPQAANIVQLEILEVYPGERWDDTAISAIIQNHTWEFTEGKISNLIQLKTEENKYREEE